MRLYGVELIVKDHSDSERGTPLPILHGTLFPISSKGSFISTDRIAHTFVTTVLHNYGIKVVACIILFWVVYINDPLLLTRINSPSCGFHFRHLFNAIFTVVNKMC